MKDLRMGVYKIVHKSGRFYIGSTTRSFHRRWSSHLSDLRNKKHKNVKLQRLWNKHGEPSFIFEVVEVCSADQCLEREQWYLDNLKPQLNTRATAEIRSGFKLSEEHKRKIGKANKGKKRTELQNKLMSELKKGKSSGLVWSDEQKKAISVRMVGITRSEETRKKIGEASRGREVSLETRQRRSIALKGKKRTPEQIKKSVDWKLGRKRDGNRGKWLPKVEPEEPAAISKYHENEKPKQRMLIQEAIRKARGGDPPAPLRGYA